MAEGMLVPIGNDQWLPVPKQNLPTEQNFQVVAQNLLALTKSVTIQQLGATALPFPGRPGPEAGRADCCEELLSLFRGLLALVASINYKLDHLSAGYLATAIPVKEPREQQRPGIDWQGVGQHALGMMRSPTVGFAAGQGLRLLGEMGTAIHPVVGTVFKLGAVLAESVDHLRIFSRQLVEANFRFAEFSGAMALVKVEQQIFDIERAMRKGEVLAPGTRDLVESLERLEKTMEPLENTFNITKNYALARVIDAVNLLITAIEVANLPLMQLVAYLNKSRGQADSLEKFVERQGRDLLQNYGKPPRFYQPP